MSQKNQDDKRGFERELPDEPGKLQQLRDKMPWFDHVMRMQERYSQQGGNHFAAGITYFSILSMIPILLLIFAVAGFILAGNDRLMQQVQEQIVSIGTGSLTDSLKALVDTAVKRRSSLGIIGLLTALWTGLSWTTNLRLGVSEMWKIDHKPESFLKGKLSDLVHFLGLLVSLIIAFAVTAMGSSGMTETVTEWLGISSFPGIGWVIWAVTLCIGLLANYIVFAWMLRFLPRAKVPWKSVLKAAVVGAIIFELIKQFGALVISKAMGNPAAAAFGPVIAIMVLFYLIWRVLLYCSAWAATTEESEKVVDIAAPPPAVISVTTYEKPQRADVDRGKVAGYSGVLGAILGASLFSIFRGK